MEHTLLEEVTRVSDEQRWLGQLACAGQLDDDGRAYLRTLDARLCELWNDIRQQRAAYRRDLDVERVGSPTSSEW